MKITGGATSGRGIHGAGIVVFATRFAIAIAEFSGLYQIILANWGTIIVVKAVAARCAAPIVTAATGYVNIAADYIASSLGTVE